MEPTEPAPGQVGGVFEHPPLSPEASEKTMYVRHDSARKAPQFTPVVTPGNDTAAHAVSAEGWNSSMRPATSAMSFLNRRWGSPPKPTRPALYEWEAQGARCNS